MSNCEEISSIEGISVVASGEGLDREVNGVFCCDLLSVAMGKATSGYAWITVMANINTLAVATLTDVACVVIAEDTDIDENTLEKAKDKGVILFKSEMPIYETAKAIDRLVNK